jgi:hypothetical protein
VFPLTVIISSRVVFAHPRFKDAPVDVPAAIFEKAIVPKSENGNNELPSEGSSTIHSTLCPRISAAESGAEIVPSTPTLSDKFSCKRVASLDLLVVSEI